MKKQGTQKDIKGKSSLKTAQQQTWHNNNNNNNNNNKEKAFVW